MTEAGLLLRAYGELVYDLLESNRDALIERAGGLLSQEAESRSFEPFDSDKYEAYREACIAFIDERTEAFNPIGVQFTFDRVREKELARLETQLSWYDSRPEFEQLLLAAHDLADGVITDDNMAILAGEMVKQCGVFPDMSIISTYERKPGLNRLPDYIVARTIEELVARESS